MIDFEACYQTPEGQFAFYLLVGENIVIFMHPESEFEPKSEKEVS